MTTPPPDLSTAARSHHHHHRRRPPRSVPALAAAGLLGLFAPMAINSPPASNTPMTVTISVVAGGGAAPAGASFGGTNALGFGAGNSLKVVNSSGLGASKLESNLFVNDPLYQNIVVGFGNSPSVFGPDGVVYQGVTLGTSSYVTRSTPGALGATQIAGSSTTPTGSSGDGGVATSAAVAPTDIAVSPNGHVFIVNSFGGAVSIRRIVPGGTITTVAGGGALGFTGTDGPATSAQISPVDIAATNDTLYLLEQSGSVLRKVDLGTGVITRVAGLAAIHGFSGDNGQASVAAICARRIAVAANGDLFLGAAADNSALQPIPCVPSLRRISNGVITSLVNAVSSGLPPNGAASGTPVPFGVTEAISVDQNGRPVVSISVPGRSSQSIYRIAANGSIEWLAGDSYESTKGGNNGASAQSAYLPEAQSISVDANGRLAIAGAGADSPIRTVVNGVLGTLDGVHGDLAGFDSSGNLYTNPTTGLPELVGIQPAGGNFSMPPDLFRSHAVLVSPDRNVYGGRALETPTELRRQGAGTAPIRTTDDYIDFRGAVDNAGNVYFSGFHTIGKWGVAGTLTQVAGTGVAGYSGDGGPATAAKLDFPTEVTVDDVGNVWFADSGRIRRIDPNGIITTVAGNGTTTYSGDGGPSTSAGLGIVNDLAVGPDGTLYLAVTDMTGVRPRGVVRKLTFTTTPTSPPTTTPAPIVPKALQPSAVPDRVLDTRTGTGGSVDPVPGRGFIRVKVAGKGDVPANASAVALNVTVTGAQGDGYLTVWPCGAPMPGTSNVNYRRGQTIPNMVISKVGENGEVCIYADATTGVLADVSAWFGPGSAYVALNPERILETRVAAGQIGYSGDKPLPGATVELQVTGVGASAVPSSAAAVVLNVTGTDATAPGYVTVWPCGEAMPTASNLNLTLNETRANLVVARVPASGKVCLFTETGTHLLADLAGYFPGGSGFTSVIPERILETRAAAGQVGYSGDKPGPDATVTLKVTGVGAANVPGDASAVVLNVTGANATAPGFVTVWPCGTDRPNASNLNLDGDAPAPNLVIAKVGTNGTVCLYTERGTHLIADLLGWFPA